MTSGHLIQGDNVHVFLYIDSAPFEIVCAETMEMLKQVELIGATTPDSGRNTEVRPRLETVFVTITGASTSENDGDISIFYLSENVREAHDLEIVWTDNNGNEVSHRQDFFIETLAINGNTGDASGYDVKLRGTGPYSQTELEDPELIGENVKSDSYTIAGGVIQDDEWIGLTSANIIAVYREGSEQRSLGLPYSFNATTGEITPDAATTIDGQRMFVIWTY